MASARLAVLALGFLGLAGCRSAAPPAAERRAPAAASVVRPEAAPAALRKFGAPLAPSTALPLAKVLEAPDTFASQTVTVEARVRRNCTRRGCWMELAEGPESDQPGCRVTFQDYGFFVPLDSAGSNARVQGQVTVRVVPPGEVQHLEGEGAKFARKEADGSAREVRMVATGVELWRGSDQRFR